MSSYVIDTLTKTFLEQWVFENPLYTKQQITDFDEFRKLFSDNSFRIDGYCIFCQKESVFTSSRSILNSHGRENALLRKGEIRFLCTRDTSHAISVYYVGNGNSFLFEFHKAGQYPSHADISNAQLNRYNKILDRKDRSEIGRANGLAAHGVNIGAFVYLRRVFERLIWRVFEESGVNIDLTEFKNLRMGQKIEALKNELPSFLSENVQIYGLLSVGIHELSEEECGGFYEVLRESIMLILDQEREQKERKAREEKVRKAVGAIQPRSKTETAGK